MKRAGTVAAAVLVTGMLVAGTTRWAEAATTVNSQQKISGVAGNFVGPLADGDTFGASVANIGDLNGDGITDLAVGANNDDDTGPQSGSLWILFMNANGTVASEQKISGTQGGFGGALNASDFFGISVANLGDLDGDGVTDLAVGAMGADDGGANRGAVWILFLNANGTVKTQQKISDLLGGFGGVLGDSDFFGRSVANLGDLDGDTIPDLAVGAFLDDDGGSDRGAVWILFMNPNGTVKTQQKISATQGAFIGVLDNGDSFGTSVAGIGDLDGDGIADLAVGATEDDDGGNARGAIWVLFLNASGTVKLEQKISDTAGNFGGLLDNVDRFGQSVANMGDLDGDAVTDLAVGAYLDDDGGSERGAVWVLFMNSDGTVKSEQKISSTAANFGGVLQDGDFFGFSAAGIGDLDGDGVTDLAVGAAEDDDGGTNRGAIWILFLTGDVTRDAVFANLNQPNRVCRGDGSGGFVSCSDVSSDTNSSLGVGLGDVDNDTFLDAVFANNGQPNRVCRGDGSGGFVSCSDVSLDTNFSRAVALGDVDGDTFLDAVFANNNQPHRVCRGDGAGGFTCSDVSSDINFSFDVALGDLDGDATLDAVFANAFEPNRVCRGDGAGGFTCSDVSSDTNSDVGVALGDLNGDTSLDAVFANLNQPNRVCRGNGNGGFISCSDVSSDLNSSRAVVLGDVDGDTFLDAIFANEGQRNRVCRGNGSGGFISCSDVDLPSISMDVALRDLDGDTFLDAVFANRLQPNHVCLGNGSGGFACSDVSPDTNNSFALALAPLGAPAANNVVGATGGTVTDPAGSGATFSVGAGVLPGDTQVFIDVIPDPGVSPLPGFIGPATVFVNFTLVPNPSPLLPPGATITLPLAFPLPVGTPLPLFEFDPPSGTLIDTGVVGTVDPGGITATFSGVTDFSVFVGFREPVPFSTFEPEVEIDDDEFEVEGSFTLGTGSDGIDPITEDATLQVGTFRATIPAGSFELTDSGPFGTAEFEGPIDGVKMEFEIRRLGGSSFEFEVEGQDAGLGGTVNPREIILIIGDDRGSGSVSAEIDGRSEKSAKSGKSGKSAKSSKSGK